MIPVHDSGADANRLENVNQLYAMADDVQLFYDNTISPTCVEDPTLHVYETEMESIGIAPNPSRGNFTINLPASIEPSKIIIADLKGKVVYSALTESMLSQFAINLNVPIGMYLVKVKNEISELTQKLIIE